MGGREKVDFRAVADAALNASGRLLSAWLPDGHQRAGEWVAANPTRNDKQAGSFSINVNSGAWSDFATGDKGGDLISLYAYLNNCQPLDAARALHELLGVPLIQEGQLPAPSASPTKGRRTDWVPVLPVPAGAPEPHKAHSVRGKPDAVWQYLDASGNTLGLIYRFRTSTGGKETLPHVYARNEKTGAQEWRWMGFSDPRPMYGLNRLAALPEATVLLVEGEKCADAGAALLDDLAVLSWPGGCKAIDKVDWSPLAGRKVMLWPDADSQREKAAVGVDPESMPYLPGDKQPGMRAMLSIGKKLVDMGCEVRLLNLPEPGTKPDGWDIADALAEDWTRADVASFMRETISPLPGACAVPEVADAADFDGAVESLSVSDWQRDLILTDNGKHIQAAVSNAYLILTNSEQWDGVLAFDEFSGKIVKRKAPPWLGGEAGEWGDGDVIKLQMWFQMRWGVMIGKPADADNAAKAVAFDNRFHFVREWVSTLPAWDGITRLTHWLDDVYGAGVSEYTQHVGQSWLVSAVARIMKPGCKVDEMIVLEGGQGSGKSTSISLLCGDKWYLETSENPSKNDFYISLAGKWLIEIGEMNSFSKADQNQIKMAVTRRDDTFRAPYDRYSSSHPRQCVFVGTTNADEYLQDATGGRRFLPVACSGPVNLDYIRTNRLQLWAEALYSYKAGFQWWALPKQLAQAEQDKRFVADVWEDPILDWLDRRSSSGRYDGEYKGNDPINSVRVGDLLRYAVQMPVDKQGKQDENRVANILKRHKWIKRQHWDGPSRRNVKIWFRPEGDLLPAQAKHRVEDVYCDEF